MSVTRRIEEDVERYLRTGDTDPLAAAWPGDLMERGADRARIFAVRSHVRSRAVR